MKRSVSSARFYTGLALGAALLLATEPSQAAGAAIPHGTVELVAENQWIQPAHESYLGLHFELEKGWHIYWVNPGDSGEPPRVAWQLPTGVTVGEIQWPTPQRLGTSSIVDFGYENGVTLLVPVHVEAPLGAKGPAQAELEAQVKVLVCREICIPGKAQLSLTVRIQLQPLEADQQTRELFAAARESLLHSPPTSWKFSVAELKDSFVLEANLGRRITRATFFPLVESQIENAAPQKTVPESSGFKMKLRKSDRLLKPIERLKGVLVLSTGRSYVIDVPIDKRGATGKAESEAKLPQG